MGLKPNLDLVETKEIAAAAAEFGVTGNGKSSWRLRQFETAEGRTPAMSATSESATSRSVSVGSLFMRPLATT